MTGAGAETGREPRDPLHQLQPRHAEDGQAGRPAEGVVHYDLQPVFVVVLHRFNNFNNAKISRYHQNQEFFCSLN
jgi:hypothetical protein